MINVNWCCTKEHGFPLFSIQLNQTVCTEDRMLCVLNYVALLNYICQLPGKAHHFVVRCKRR